MTRDVNAFVAAARSRDVNAFVAAARSLVGKARWRHRGRTPWAVDCLGLLVLSARAAGFDIAHIPKVYGREPWDDQLRKGLELNFGPAYPSGNARFGDVLLIRWGSNEPSHVAIAADHPDGGLSMIHAHNVAGVVECRVAHPFDKCIVEVYRPCATFFR